MNRAKSVFSMASLASVAPVPAAAPAATSIVDPLSLSKARQLRDESQRSSCGSSSSVVHSAIASSLHVPYTELRRERPFLFDDQQHPLHEALAKALCVNDLRDLHLSRNNQNNHPLELLRDSSHREHFHSVYDQFMTSFILPLCHSLAIANNVLHVYSADRITYRYQAFPTIRILRPGDKPMAPTCGVSRGHSIAALQFYIPLTPSTSANPTLITESYPGREDWHALVAKSFGLGYIFDGVRCLHFETPNTTSETQVALHFSVMLYQDAKAAAANTQMLSSSFGLPTVDQLQQDVFVRTDSTFYEEAVLDLSQRCHRDVVVKKNTQLRQPSVLLGFPFDKKQHGD